jgi:predicted regulator of Ras-like GTPase activity (Roadblock/LC7/MglB family)
MALTRLAIPGEEARKGELFRSLVIGTDDAVHFRNQLSRLNQEGGAVGSLLVDESTGVIASHGRIPSDNFESLGALLACNFTAAHELASNLSGSSFAGIMQIGKKWVMRATRVDQRRFLVLVCEKGFSYKKLNNAVTYFRGPLEGYLKRVDTMSPNRLSRFSGLLSSVTEIGIAGKTQA